MRQRDEKSRALFSSVDLEEYIPIRHSLRKIRRIVNDALASMDAELDRLYAGDDRRRLLPASLIQTLFPVNSGQ